MVDSSKRLSRARSLGLVLSLMTAACDEDAAPPAPSPLDGAVAPLECREVHESIQAKLRDDPVLDGLRTCDRDDDCIRLPVEIDCSEQHVLVETCGTAIAGTQLDAGTAWRRAAQTELCVGAANELACRLVYKCSPDEPICVAHVCTLGRKGADAGAP